MEWVEATPPPATVATLAAIEAAGPTSGVRVGKPRPRRLKGVADRIPVAEIRSDPPAA